MNSQPSSNVPTDEGPSESPIWKTLHDERLLRDQYDELAALAGSLAHEIKNPLSVIRMNMELLAEDFQQGRSPQIRRARERIDTVNRQCIRLETLLDDFLRFARYQNLELRPGKLNDQVNYVLDLFEPQAARQGVEVIRKLDPDLPLIRLDSQTLQAALVNLVKNALEAMPDGGKLLMRTRVTKQGVALDLIDSGCGMTTKTIMNMFKTFYTSKQGGSGLGLPLAKKIIEAHGGRINVQSVVGQGTQFTLEFPTPKRI